MVAFLTFEWVPIWYWRADGALVLSLVNALALQSYISFNDNLFPLYCFSVMSDYSFGVAADHVGSGGSLGSVSTDIW
jgi:hypothetical protein